MTLYDFVPLLLAVLLAAEAGIARWRRMPVFGLADTAASLAVGIGSRAVVVPWTIAEFALYRWADDRTPWGLESSALAYALGIVGVDIAFYAYHRAHHEVRALWAIHVPHHSSQHFNLSTAARQPWIPFTLTAFYLPLVPLGLPAEAVVAGIVVNTVYSFVLHTQLVGRFPGWVEGVLNTPSNHRVHHGRNPQYLGRNYGGVLVVWDRVFGTYEPEGETVRYGTADGFSSHNPLRIVGHELVPLVAGIRQRRREPSRA